VEAVELLGSEEQFELYADDIVMEFPYGPSLGMPDRFETKPNVVAYVQRILEGLSGVVIRELSLSPVAGDPTTVFVEYEADCPTPGGNTYRQIYVNKMQFRDGNRGATDASAPTPEGDRRRRWSSRPCLTHHPNQPEGERHD
jgi:ketosteroid isomerase-like protein